LLIKAEKQLSQTLGIVSFSEILISIQFLTIFSYFYFLPI